MANQGDVTGAQAGLSADDQIRIALEAILAHDGLATMQQIYQATDEKLAPRRLSEQGKASLRRLVNSAAVEAGYIYPHDPQNPGWRSTVDGRSFLESPIAAPEEVVDTHTQAVELRRPSIVFATAFELYMMKVFQRIYPRHAWYHQGKHKTHERGLDLIGTRLGEPDAAPGAIGVPIKLHASDNAPSQLEWLKFPAGCFSRRVDTGIFATSGKLLSEQRREAGEARVIVVEGREEISRIAQLHGIAAFVDFDTDEIAGIASA
jgi:hypothetical protein